MSNHREAWLCVIQDGERQYTAEDSAGHQWTFFETLADVAPEDWGGTSMSSD